MLKKLCILLSLVLALTALGACSPKKKTDDSSKPVISQQEGTTSDTEQSGDLLEDNEDTAYDSDGGSDSGEEIEFVTPEDTNATLTALENAVELNVYNDEKPISTTYRGYSGAVHHAYHYMDDVSYERNYTPKMLSTELNRLEEAGIKYTRTGFHSRWVWDAKTETYDFNTKRFDEFVAYAKDMESKGISVVMHLGWHLGFLTKTLEYSADLGEQPYHEGNGPDKYGESIGCDFTGYTAEETRMIKGARRYGYWYAESLRQLRARGVNNIDYLLYFTESWAPNKVEYTFVSAAIKEKLVEEGVADTVKHIGPNTYSDSSEGVLEYVIEHEPDLFDVLSAHHYPKAARATDDLYYDIISPTYKSYMKAVKEAVQWPRKEFWIDETHIKDDTSEDDMISNGWYGLQMALQGIIAQQEGINNIILWNLIDQRWDTGSVANGSSTQHGIQFASSIPNLLYSAIPRDQYYFHSLFAKYNGYQNGTVYRTNMEELADMAYGVYIGAVKLEDGSWTITVLNLNIMPETVIVEFDESIDQTLYRHMATEGQLKPDASARLADVDKVYTSVQDRFWDTIPGGTVAIYTGVKG